MISREQHDRMANAIRFLSMDAVEKANSGHPGLPMGAADVATVLFSRYLKFNPKAPLWADRDRFVLSAGHGSMLIYSLLYLTGYEDMSIEDLKQFRQLGSKTAGHPEYGHASGIETTTGPLGQGIANAVGMAIAERKLAEEFGSDLQDHFTYVLCGDGCLMEGISHEAIALAGHLKLNKLVLFWDDNNITIDGAVSLSDSTDQIARFQAVHWNTIRVDGHNPDEIAAAIEAAQKSDRPTFIACKTVIGFGAPNKQGTHKVHGSPLGAEEIAATRKALNWEAEAFSVPADVLDAWRAAGTRSVDANKAWDARLTATETTKKSEFTRRFAGELPAGLDGAIDTYKKKLAGSPAGHRHPQGLGRCARSDQRHPAGDAGRLGRPDAVEQHQDQPDEIDHACRFLRSLHALGHPRARHGCSNERHRPAWRPDPLCRRLHDLLGLLPSVDPACSADGHPRHPCPDP